MRTWVLPLPFLIVMFSCYGSDDVSRTGGDPSLKDLLPDEAGFRWDYWGFAEYVHWMQLDEIATIEEGTVYRVSGMVKDMSDGESSLDFSIELEYLVSDSVLSVVQRRSVAIDNDFREMELLRLPLAEGSRWTQTAIDGEGSAVELECVIEEIAEGSLTVRYSEADSPFYQLRIFEEGIGVVTFEKLFIHPEGSLEIGYTLFRGY